MPWEWRHANYCYTDPGAPSGQPPRIVILKRERGFGEGGGASYYIQGILAENPNRAYVDDFDVALADARRILIEHGHDPYA